MKEAATKQHEMPAIELLRASPIFEEVAAVDSELNASVCGSAAEAHELAREFIELLDILADKAGLIGESVELLSPDLQRPVMQTDGMTGRISYTWGSPPLDLELADGSYSMRGTFAGFTAYVLPLTSNNQSVGLFSPRLCYQIATSAPSYFPQFIDKVVMSAFAPIEGSKLVFASDVEKEQAKIRLDRLSQIDDIETVRVVSGVNRRLSADDRYAVNTLRYVGKRVRQRLDKLFLAADDQTIDQLKPEILGLIRARLRIGATANVIVKASRAWAYDTDTTCDRTTGEAVIASEMIDVVYMPYFFQRGQYQIVKEEQTAHMPCLVFRTANDESSTTVYIPLERITAFGRAE